MITMYHYYFSNLSIQVLFIPKYSQWHLVTLAVCRSWVNSLVTCHGPIPEQAQHINFQLRHHPFISLQLDTRRSTIHHRVGCMFHRCPRRENHKFAWLQNSGIHSARQSWRIPLTIWSTVVTICNAWLNISAFRTHIHTHTHIRHKCCLWKKCRFY